MANTEIKMTICGNDVSLYRIVRPAESYPSEYTAADELAKYIKLTCGIELPVVTDGNAPSEYEIVVGKTGREPDGLIRREKYEYEGYRIAAQGNKLFIAGAVRRGTMYGVYDFIEKFLGWRFYTPELERRVASGDVCVPADVDIEKIPVFEYRDIDWVYARDQVYAAKVHVNGGYRTFDEAHGGELAHGGGDHNMGDFFDIENSHIQQPCLSDPEKVDLAIKRIGEYLERHPDLDIFEISQNDNQAYCTCPRCKAIDEEEGNHAGTMLRFINKVSDAFREKYPKLHIETFAYQYTRHAPKITKPRDNVIIKICPMECCYHHPLYDPNCQANVDFARDFESWSAVAKKMYVWEYSTNFAYFLAPFPNFETQRLNCRWYADNHVAGLYPEGNYCARSGEFGELRGYLQARLMWDPYMTEEQYYEYMDDFLEAYYGPGWREVRKFIDWTRRESVKQHCDIWSHPNIVIPLEIWHDACEEIGGWWDAAEESAKDMPFQLANVKRSRLQFTLIEQTVMWEERFRDAGNRTKENYRQKNMAFYNTLVKQDISWREAYGFPPKVNFEAPPLAWCDAHTYMNPYEEDQLLTDD